MYHQWAPVSNQRVIDLTGAKVIIVFKNLYKYHSRFVNGV